MEGSRENREKNLSYQRIRNVEMQSFVLKFDLGGGMIMSVSIKKVLTLSMTVHWNLTSMSQD